ncbi:hypothetical protein COLO4_11039 [Corchorus olitorius]|uniref:Uncharacterized protein n=1 Tax=Corchorus olitorius TaxID=93759 RepID=A0A1R3K5X6_9ROSI|nr:hypothetical protein COLO4_11039 [Corchorus olitorius]
MEERESTGEGVTARNFSQSGIGQVGQRPHHVKRSCFQGCPGFSSPYLGGIIIGLPSPKSAHLETVPVIVLQAATPVAFSISLFSPGLSLSLIRKADVLFGLK